MNAERWLNAYPIFSARAMKSPSTSMISVPNHYQLHTLVHNTIALEGPHCDLNHIDVSQVPNMQGLFAGSVFEGDISWWDVSNVTDFSFMFSGTNFTGDLSQWNINEKGILTSNIGTTHLKKMQGPSAFHWRYAAHTANMKDKESALQQIWLEYF